MVAKTAKKNESAPAEEQTNQQGAQQQPVQNKNPSEDHPNNVIAPSPEKEPEKAPEPSDEDRADLTHATQNEKQRMDTCNDFIRKVHELGSIDALNAEYDGIVLWYGEETAIPDRLSEVMDYKAKQLESMNMDKKADIKTSVPHPSTNLSKWKKMTHAEAQEYDKQGRLGGYNRKTGMGYVV